MKYPYITIDQRKPVLIYKDRRGIYMVDKNDTLSGLDITYVKHQKNQTAKVLANTYGEVKSKAHAEFIVKLAENHGYTLTGAVDKSNARTFVIDGENKLLFFMRGSSSFGGSTVKKITIPLPPECDTEDEWPKVGDEVWIDGTEFKGEVISKKGKWLWVCNCKNKIPSTYEISEVSKPKTPEQELRDFISLLWIENNHDLDMFLDIVTEHVIKKPQ